MLKMGARERKPKLGTPSFFKILFDPSTPYLQLPPAFVSKQNLKNKVPKSAKLETVTGEYSWPLKIKELCGNYCFVDGWSKVVKDAQLGFGDFLLFWLIDQSTFQVSIFSPNGCEKDLSTIFTDAKCDLCRTRSNLKTKNVVKIEDDNTITMIKSEDDDDGDEDKDEEDEHLSFKVVAKSGRYQAYIPASFARKSKIATKNEVTVKNLKGKEWCIVIRKEKEGKYFFSAGWVNFCKQNGLSNDDTCSFNFIKNEGKLLLTQVIEKKIVATKRGSRWLLNKTLAMEGVKRKRGRPVKTEPKECEFGV